MKLDGKVAFVTGGSGDIGGAIARELTREGADVAISYVGQKEAADKAVADIQAEDRRGLAVQLDQRDEKSIDTCVAPIVDHFGRLDILVNNAAWNIGIPFPEIDKLTADIWDRVLETNLRGPFLLSRAFADVLKSDGGGHIVNISSVGGLSPGSSSIAYSSSKAGLNHLTRCLAVALAPEVAVNCICPGLVEGTRMAGNLPEPLVQGARQQAVRGRVGDPGDIARQTVAFCTSVSVSGQIVAIDGGMPLGMH